MPQGRRIGTGDIVGERFRLVEEIGEGGMGRVYQAIDTRHDRAAAVKIISRHLAQDVEFRARFEREAQAAERANHPHILPVWDYGSAGRGLYLATPLCDTDLASYVEEHGRLALEAALRLLSQVAWALDWAHNRGVIHRDVKPENILLVRGVVDIHAYLADFGMARISSAVTLTQHGQAPGLSPAYAAPELWEGRTVTPATDQYALAATTFACLAGKPPFVADSLAAMRSAHLEQPPPPLPVADLPQAGAVSRVLSVALAKEPGARYGSCQELMAALRDASGQVPEGADRALPPGMSRAPTDPEHPSSARRPAQENTEAATGPSSVPPGPLADAGPPPTAPETTPEPAVAPVAGALTERDDGPAARQPDAATGPLPPGSGARTVPERRSAPTSRGVSGLRQRLGTARGRVVVAIALAALVVVAAAVAAAMLISGPDDPPPATVTRVGAVPSDLAAADDAVWVANQRDGTVSRIDTADGEKVGGDLRAVRQTSQIAADRNGVWAASADGQVQGFDADSGQPLGPPLDLETTIYDMALSAGALWIADGQGAVTQVPLNGRILATPRAPVAVSTSVSALTVGSGRLWALGAGGELAGLDLRSGQITSRVETRRRDAAQIAAVGSTVWVADGPAGRLVALDGATGDVHHTMPVPEGRAVGLAAADGTVGYVTFDDGRAVAVDSATAAVRPLPNLPARGSAAVIAEDRLWLAHPASHTVRSVPLPEGDS